MPDHVGLPDDSVLARLDDAALIYQVVNGGGREVVAAGRRLFEVVHGDHQGARGDAIMLRELTGRRLHWKYGWAVDVESGAIRKREDVSGNGS